MSKDSNETRPPCQGDLFPHHDAPPPVYGEPHLPSATVHISADLWNALVRRVESIEAQVYGDDND
jgi:hypothetical protein